MTGFRNNFQIHRQLLGQPFLSHKQLWESQKSSLKRFNGKMFTTSKWFHNLEARKASPILFPLRYNARMALYLLSWDYFFVFRTFEPVPSLWSLSSSGAYRYISHIISTKLLLPSVIVKSRKFGHYPVKLTAKNIVLLAEMGRQSQTRKFFSSFCYRKISWVFQFVDRKSANFQY
jgi:hypothetical protein